MGGLVQVRRNSSALAMELRLSCTNSSKYDIDGGENDSRLCLLNINFIGLIYQFGGERCQEWKKKKSRYAYIRTYNDT